MKKKELLKIIIDGNYKEYEYKNLIKLVGENESKLIRELIGTKYIDEVKRNVYAGSRGNIEIIHYTVSEKGYLVFEPFYKKIWFTLKGDIRTIIIAVITSIIITIITIYITKFIN